MTKKKDDDKKKDDGRANFLSESQRERRRQRQIPFGVTARTRTASGSLGNEK
jgi:hypothetical protein